MKTKKDKLVELWKRTAMKFPHLHATSRSLCLEKIGNTYVMYLNGPIPSQLKNGESANFSIELSRAVQGCELLSLIEEGISREEFVALQALTRIADEDSPGAIHFLLDKLLELQE